MSYWSKAPYTSNDKSQDSGKTMITRLLQILTFKAIALASSGRCKWLFEFSIRSLQVKILILQEAIFFFDFSIQTDIPFFFSCIHGLHVKLLVALIINNKLNSDLKGLNSKWKRVYSCPKKKSEISIQVVLRMKR